MLLLHHRPTSVTLRLTSPGRPEVTISRDNGRTLCGHLLPLVWDPQELGNSVAHARVRGNAPDEEALYSARSASEEEWADHLRATAGSPLELLVRKAACADAADLACGWNVRADGILVHADADAAYCQLSNDGCRLAPNGSLLHNFPEREGKMTMLLDSTLLSVYR